MTSRHLRLLRGRLLPAAVAAHASSPTCCAASAAARRARSARSLSARRLEMTRRIRITSSATESNGPMIGALPVGLHRAPPPHHDVRLVRAAIARRSEPARLPHAAAFWVARPSRARRLAMGYERLRAQPAARRWGRPAANIESHACLVGSEREESFFGRRYLFFESDVAVRPSRARAPGFADDMILDRTRTRGARLHAVLSVRFKEKMITSGSYWSARRFAMFASRYVSASPSLLYSCDLIWSFSRPCRSVSRLKLLFEAVAALSAAAFFTASDCAATVSIAGAAVSRPERNDDITYTVPERFVMDSRRFIAVIFATRDVTVEPGL